MYNAADEAVEVTNSAAQQVSATEQKLNKITSDILNIQQLDPSRIEKLRQEVSTDIFISSVELFFDYYIIEPMFYADRDKK